MSKSILVIDTPENCEQCRFSGCDEDVCCLEDQLISEREYFDKKPDWCPLKDVPDKKEITDDNFSLSVDNVWNKAWNACIDEILEGGNVNE